jgi:hypothetical protein
MSDPRTGRHWSTDFVQHIRMVHFTLIAVCVALFVLSISRAPTEVQTAHDQIRQILEFLGKKTQSVPPTEAPLWNWLEEGTRARLDEWLKLSRLGHPDSPSSLAQEPHAVELVIDGVKCQAPIKFNTFDNPFGGKDYIWDLIRRSPGERFPGLPGQNSLQSPFSTRIQTVEQFRNMWDSAGHVFIDVPISLAGFAYVWKPTVDRSLTLRRWVSVPLNVLKAGPLPDEPWPGEGLLHLNTYPEQDIKDMETNGVSLPTNLGFAGTVNCVKSNGASGSVQNSSITISIPVWKFESVPFDAQSVLISHSKKEWAWKHGTFDYSFRELSEITREYPGIDIETGEQVLFGETKRAGESFELFGIKLPAQITVRWGLLLIIGVQIYFWIHLIELKPKLRRDDPGWDVAWIGVYASNYAKVVMFVSTCLLPLAAALALGIRGLYISSSPITNWALLILGSVATATLGLFTWMRLPSIGEP